MITVGDFFRRLFRNPKDPIVEMIILADKLSFEHLKDIAEYCLALRKLRKKKQVKK